MAQQISREIEKLTLEGQKRLIMSGVETVDSFSEQNLKLTVGGNRVLVSGQDIKITAFNKETGSLSADGIFCEIKYLNKKTPLVKKIFK